MESTTDTKNDNEQTITEGFATVKTQGNVFYNPVQEFNRDLRYLTNNSSLLINLVNINN